MNSKLAIQGGAPAVTAALPVWPEVDQADEQALLSTLKNGAWWMYDERFAPGEDGGPAQLQSQVACFEREFAAMHNVKHAITVNSGSSALELCMRAAGVRPGDEVITTPYTFFATSSCILNVGGIPVYVDIDPESYNIDPTKIEAAITPRTRAIMPVHFAGELADVEAIAAIAKRHNLAMVEDAAQAQGVCLEGDRYAGSFGNGGIFSFQASKNLNCGEGGAILTNDDHFAQTGWSLRHYGRRPEGNWYEHYHAGWNLRMHEFSAALLRSQLAKLQDQNQRRAANVNYLYERLRDVDGLTPIRLHPKATRRNHHLVIIRFRADRWDGVTRERCIDALNAEGVPCAIGYTIGNHENPVLESLQPQPFGLTDSPADRARLDFAKYRELCPVSHQATREEAIWMNQPQFLGRDTTLVEQFADAFEKVWRSRGEIPRD